MSEEYGTRHFPDFAAPEGDGPSEPAYGQPGARSAPFGPSGAQPQPQSNWPPAYGSPDPRAAGYQLSGYGSPNIGPAGYGQPGTGQPGPGQPGPGQPGPGQPGFGYPGVGQAGFGPGQPAARVLRQDQRPGLITLSVVLIVTGSLLWMTALGFVWIIAVSVRDSFGYQGAEGVFYHLLNRFHLRMLEQGLAIVLFGFPLAAVVLSFFLFLRRAWPRIVINLLGLAAVICVPVMLRNSLLWVAPGAAYIAFSCLILWAPSVSRWYAAADEPTPGRMGP